MICFTSKKVPETERATVQLAQHSAQSVAFRPWQLIGEKNDTSMNGATTHGGAGGPTHQKLPPNSEFRDNDRILPRDRK